MIATIATLKVQEQKIVEFERDFTQLSDAVHASEPDTLFYQLFRSRSEPFTYRVIEVYRTAEASEFHRTTSHFKEIAPRLGGAFASAPEVEYCDSVGV